MSTLLLSVGFVCVSSTDICEHRGGQGRNSLLHISEEDWAYKGTFFFYSLLIRCPKLGLNVLPQQEDFTDLLQAVYIQQDWGVWPLKKQNSQQKFSWQHCVKSSYSSCTGAVCEILFIFDHLLVRTVWDTQRLLWAAAAVAAIVAATREIM